MTDTLQNLKSITHTREHILIQATFGETEGFLKIQSFIHICLLYNRKKSNQSPTVI